VHDLLVNLLASVVAGSAVWLSQRLLRYRKLARQRSFFGVTQGSEVLLAVARHAASPHRRSVNRRDVAALVELVTIVRDCGGRAELVAEDDVPDGIGRSTEFCVGGPGTNARTAAHLRSILRGVEWALDQPDHAEPGFSVGTTTFQRELDRAEYVVLARAWGPEGGRPVFLLSGQNARSNLAAARFLTTRYPQLYRRYGASRPFCFVLRIVEPGVYGADFTEIAADVSDAAFTAPEGT
jgi:hypothetical protein